ncbi:unnamed protein product [Rhizoctonia solani]|uniref:Probable cytosolic iron-sulfur protein assembly protein 1 n=1 Tax=Rhizoctonia solani TaxID=456999 RepID=A0A8H2ZZD8_9AGAM|nr:unnamed protein product [Rhizoctonia solani]
MTESSFVIRQIASLPGHEDRAWQVAWNPDAPILASCSTDKTVRLYSYSAPPPDSTDDAHDYRFNLATSISTGHTRTVRTIAWAPGGKSLAVGSFDSTISVWERTTEDDSEGKEHGSDHPSSEWEMVSQLEGHENECKSVAYSNSGTLLASCSRDKSVWVWEVQPDAEFECLSVMMEHSQDVKAVTFHPREDILASASYDDTIKLYVDDPSDDWYSFATLKGHMSTVWAISFSPCGNFLASSSDDKTIRVWRHVPADTGSYSAGDWQPALDWVAHSRPIYSISWGPKVPGVGSESSLGCIASSGGDGQIRIWEVSDTSSELAQYEICSYDRAHGDAEVNSVSWCPRPRMNGILATAGDDGIVNIWKVIHAYKTEILNPGSFQPFIRPFWLLLIPSLLSRQGWARELLGLMLIDGSTDLRFAFVILGFSCKACYAVKRNCQYPTEVYQGCIQCETRGTRCEPREWPPSKYTMNFSRSTTGPKRRSVDSSALGLYVPESLSSGSERIGSDPVLFDDRGFDISSRARRRPRHRASNSADAFVSIGAIQFAGTTTLVRNGILHPSELVELYHLFVTRWNPCILVLDPSLHTIQYLTNFELLLSVVLAVAAQEYHPRPELCEQLMYHARSIAGKELLETPTVETVQALLLLSLFPNWGLSFDQNRSWLDLGLALDLARQLEMDKVASTFDPCNTSSTERNVFRTWIICHNLDAVTSSVFDRPSSFAPILPEQRRWPKKANDSYEGMVGVLAEPLQLLELHIKQQSLNKLLYGADYIRGINQGESTTSPRLLDSKIITSMETGISEQSAFWANERSEQLPFWFHMANITTAYSRLLLLSRYPLTDKCFQEPETCSNIIDSARCILESYANMFVNCGYAKYAPGCFFTHGLLATAIVYKFIDSMESDDSRVLMVNLAKQFSNSLRMSPTVTRPEAKQGVFIQTLDYIQRDRSNGTGGMSESLSRQEPIIPILTTIFPGWWRLYL